jgi:predicted nucleotidyltransferase
MRLNDSEKAAIKETINLFDDRAKIYLFGSRVDDTKKGGDIDLLIMSSKLTFEDKIKIRLKLFDKIGEQKIDLLIAKDTSNPFVRIALNNGMML